MSKFPKMANYSFTSAVPIAIKFTVMKSVFENIEEQQILNKHF